MRTALPAALTALLTLGCAGDADKNPGGAGGYDDTGAGPPPVWCDGATAHVWDPWGATDIELFPDGVLEIDDPSTPTGRRLDVSVERAPWADDLPALLADAVASAGDLSGFGTLGGALLRFSAPVTNAPTTVEESLDGPWMLVDLEATPPERVPFEAEVKEDGLTVLLWPLRPMRKGTRHALVVTTDVTAADGGCVAPAEATRSLLYGDEALDDPLLADAAPRYRDALATLELDAGDVSMLSVFTTHNDVDVARQLAAAVPDHPVEWVGDPTCSDAGEILRCEARLTVLDHRNALGLIDATVEPVEAEIPVTIWLPNRDGGPWPVVIYGHGLGSGRSESIFAAEAMGDEGYAVVAMDAVHHGEHPTADDDGGNDALKFLGIDFDTFSLDARAIRGNFDQTNLDRLRLIHLVRSHPDLDGDGVAEFDRDRVGYLGASLGAVLGSQLLALSPDLAGGVLSVGGARLMTIVTDTEQLGAFSDLIGSLVGSVERFDRLTAVAQHLVDSADGGAYAPHVLHDRWDGRPAPHLLVQVALDDAVVPYTSGHALARALDIPHMEPVAEPVDLLTTTDADPVIANLPDGTTAAFFQFDRVTRDGSVIPAGHVDTPKSEEGTLQMQTFLQTWIAGGPVEILDPYEALGTPE